MGNSIRFTSSIQVETNLSVPPFSNLFAAGERAGFMVGHTEAMVTGNLAGYNAWRWISGEEPLVLPRNTASGELIAFTRPRPFIRKGGGEMYTLSGGPLWENLLRKGLYFTDQDRLKPRLHKLNLLGIYNPSIAKKE